jgi:hypothetical protein
VDNRRDDDPSFVRRRRGGRRVETNGGVAAAQQPWSAVARVGYLDGDRETVKGERPQTVYEQ